ncbi:eEF1-gamma domain-containing protein [Athelia psychrophila]|uniref:EEF1-gamma domain-containing protein n=1 Tax=Athelia psychrophila TaxID=1759441 RepID=A0A166VYP3_9AGAM|nr:eEF1-gamma domain-containing protein [Fibularhizoctonia sp. CBS 109695]
MSIGTLWTAPAQRQGKVIRAVAALGGLQINLPDTYTHYEDNKKPEFLAKFPHGKIPAWEGKDGFLLSEGTPIAKYIASLAPNSGLLGVDAKDAALVDQWIHFTDTEVEVPYSILWFMFSGGIPYLKPIHAAMLEGLIRSLTTVNEHLMMRTFLVTERITVADIVLAAIIQTAVSNFFDAELRAQLPNVVRHLETIVNQPKLKEFFGETTYIEKAKQFVAPKKEAKPAAPKAEKKPKAPTAEDDGEDEPLVPAEPKVANPLDSLPKSTFNLEDWKRAYSNKETRGAGGAIEWFYENFDKDGFSVWRVDFKYPTELTQTFMSSNQIGGFFNRLEASRKYLFGSVGVLGSANDSLISGTFILRGPDVIPVVDVAPDFESYEYKKLDLENADDKAFFESALAWELEIDGKKWVDGKNFK